jgi:hypothetical protein
MVGSGIVLARDGRAAATIVVAPDVGTHTRNAVEDLVRIIAQMTARGKLGGAVLPVVTDGTQQSEDAQVHVGQTAFVLAQSLVPESLPVNGFRLVTIQAESKPCLVIAGPTDLGTSHGVYTLLGDVLGVMWGMADPMFEDVPISRTVELGYIDRTEEPAFGFRCWSGNVPGFLRRNRVDDGSRILPYYGHGHNLFSIVPPSKYANHPEYYCALPVDGGGVERQVPEEDGHTHIQPCLTNKDVIRITIETVREFFDANPNVSTYSLCPNDSGDFCQCPDCFALDDGMPEYRGRRMNSDSYFHYISEVSKELIKTHPDRYVGVYAYWTTELPPRNLDKLLPNVVVYLTQDSSQYHDAAYEKRDHELLEVWSKVAHHLAVYCYYGLGWFPPRVYTEYSARTIPYLPTVSVKGFYCETYPYWAHTGPQLWLASRLLWDTSVDAKALLDEYYERMFGEVAAEMKEFYRIIESGWTTPREGKWFQGLDWLAEQLQQLPADARDAAWKQINVALASAQSDVTRARVTYVLNGNKLSYLLSKSFEEAHALLTETGSLEAQLEHLLKRVGDAVHVYRTKIETDETYGHAYYQGERGEVQIRWWMGHMATVVEDAIASAPEALDRVKSDTTWQLMLESKDYPDVPRRIGESRPMYGVK